MEYISYELFKKMDIRVGTIVSVEEMVGADKLLICQVDVGDETPRQIVSGIRPYVSDPQTLVGKQLLYIVNLEPRTIRGSVSEGMLLAVGEGDPVFLIPEKPVPPGSAVR